MVRGIALYFYYDGDAMLCDDYESFMMIVLVVVVER